MAKVKWLALIIVLLLSASFVSTCAARRMIIYADFTVEASGNCAVIGFKAEIAN
jgi:hypothetical protein